MRSSQSDSLYRKILHSAATKEQKAVFIAAFEMARTLTGSRNSIGNLEVICAEFLATYYPVADKK